MGGSYAQRQRGGLPVWNSSTVEREQVVGATSSAQLIIAPGAYCLHIQVTGSDAIWVTPDTGTPSSGINLDSTAGGRDHYWLWIPTCRTVNNPVVYLNNPSGSSVSVYVTSFLED